MFIIYYMIFERQKQPAAFVQLVVTTHFFWFHRTPARHIDNIILILLHVKWIAVLFLAHLEFLLHRYKICSLIFLFHSYKLQPAITYSYWFFMYFVFLWALFFFFLSVANEPCSQLWFCGFSSTILMGFTIYFFVCSSCKCTFWSFSQNQENELTNGSHSVQQQKYEAKASEQISSKESFERTPYVTACLTYVGFYILMLLGFLSQFLYKPKVAIEKNREVSEVFAHFFTRASNTRYFSYMFLPSNFRVTPHYMIASNNFTCVTSIVVFVIVSISQYAVYQVQRLH